MAQPFRAPAFLLSTILVCSGSLALAQNPPAEPGLGQKAADMPPTANAPAAPAGVPSAPVQGSVKMASVRFLEPKEGATVAKTFKMKFAVDGLKVVPAGKVVPGTGHFHVMVDAGPAKEGQVVTVDDKHIHYGKGETEANLTLAPGAHTLTLQFADGAHRAYAAQMSQTIHVTVK